MVTEPEFVPRPHRKSDYRIKLISGQAQKGWRDLRATALNAATKAWHHLTETPTDQSDICYPLKDKFEFLTFEGIKYQRWQYKPTDGGRIWYAVIPATRNPEKVGIIAVERVHTGHPNETVKNFR